VPRRRFSRAADGPSRERRFTRTDERRPAHEPAERPEGAGAADGRRTVVIARDDLPSEIAAVTADRDLGDLEDAPPTPPERRTIKIGGHPEGSLEAARFHRDLQRRRPPRTAHERLGARPERLAAWAFALGLLLILIAILSAH
jgi:hypothetical protein